MSSLVLIEREQELVAYYNEIDPYAAAWLRNLIAAGRIPWGYVDERDIRDVTPADLGEYSQCHFFAGIGGWPLALALAGVPADRPLWTGSCPCQPFSIAGRHGGFDDRRHLWPTWFALIKECRPPTVFGEQVANAKVWLDGVFADLESVDYACGAAVIPACAVDAPHQRKRLWFVADAGDGRHWPPEETVCTGRNATDAGGGAVADADNGHSFWWSGPLQVGWNSIAGKAETSSQRGRTQWRIKPGLPLLADGVPNRVGRLSAYGNAIVPQAAAEFIRAHFS